MLCTVVGEFHAIFVLKVYVTFFDEELECFSEHTLERKGEKKYNIIPKKKKKEGRKEGRKETESSVKGKWIVISAEFVNKSTKHLKKNKIPMKHQIY